jgi:Lysozyme like domain
MAVKGVNGMAVAAAGAGTLFAWSGIKGGKVTSNLRSLLSGYQPRSGTAYPITTPGGGDALSSVPDTAVGSGSFSAVLGGTYSNSQLQALWIMAGGSPGKAAVAACIADHESSGDPKATSSNPDGGTNVGLWQLDTKGKGAGYSVAQLQNALTNARVAVAGSSNGTDWSAWSTAASCGV